MQMNRNMRFLSILVCTVLCVSAAVVIVVRHRTRSPYRSCDAGHGKEAAAASSFGEEFEFSGEGGLPVCTTVSAGASRRRVGGRNVDAPTRGHLPTHGGQSRSNGADTGTPAQGGAVRDAATSANQLGRYADQRDGTSTTPAGPADSTNSLDAMDDPGFRAAMRCISVGTDELLVYLDRNAEGATCVATNGYLRVGRDLLNSDLFEGAFSNAACVWITGMNRFDDPLTLDSLQVDYRDRLFEVPGIGYCLLREDAAPGSEGFINSKIEVLNDAIDVRPSGELYIALAKTYAEDAGDIDKAIQTMKKWPGAGKGDGKWDYEMAELYRLASQSAQEHATSETLLRQAAQSYENINLSTADPQIARNVCLRLADTYEQLGARAQAKEVLEDAFQRYQDGSHAEWSTRTARQLGEYCFRDGDYSKAIEWYEAAPAPQFMTHVRKAEAYERVGEIENAISSYETAARERKNNPVPIIRAGILYGRLGRHDEVEDVYERVQKALARMTKKRRRSTLANSEYIELQSLYKARGE